MRNLILFSLLLFLTAAPVSATPTITYESDPVEVFTVLDNFWWDGQAPISTQWEHHPMNNPYPGGSTAYQQALEDGLIAGAELTVVVDDLDLGNSAQISVQDKDGIWHDTDRHGNIMLLNTLSFADTYGLNEGPGNPSHQTSTTFDLDPYWLSNSAIGVKLNWAANGGLNQLEVETSAIDITAYSPVTPAPQAILLVTFGMGIVGWLHRRNIL